MAASDLSAWDSWCSSQLNIVLLGGRNSGKNSVGNLILGKEEFVTKERTSCSRRLGVVARRWLTVVDTPGWWCDFSAQETSNLVRREILSSVSLCSPGPHVFLITVKASSAFSERRRRAVEEHVALLGDKVWSHCMVVFTSTYRFEYRKEECVERGGKALRWLTEKCSQRCHSVVLNDDADVRELLVKIQKLVAGNGNKVFEMQENILLTVAEEKRGVEERAQRRFIRMKQHRSLMREHLKPVTSIRIVLLGAKGSGKTSALNTILCRESGQELQRTAQCWVGEEVVFGRQVTVVDTPGWWMNYFCDESSRFDQREMVLSLSRCPPGPHVFLLVIRVDRAFPETYRRAVQEHLELISEHIWSRVILLFSFGDWLGGTMTEQYIESEGEPLRWLVEKCCNRYHVLNSKTRGDGFQVRELIGKIEEMMAGCNGGWHYEIDRKVLEELERTMKEETERARRRQMKKEEKRQMARSQLAMLSPLPELRIVLVGGRKVGKSSCGNTILSRESFDTDTQTTSCTETRGKITDKMLTVVDTPGCFPVTSDLQTTHSAFLLVVNISSSFKDVHREALEKQLEAGGGQLWSRAMVLFSYGDWLGDTSLEQRIESGGEPLQRLVEQCGNRYHVLDNKNSGHGGQVRDLLDLVEEMLVAQRLADLHRVPESATSTTHSSPAGPEMSDVAQVVALPASRARWRTRVSFADRRSFMSYMASIFSGKQGLMWQTVDLPVRFPAPHSQLRLSTDNNSLSHQTMLLLSCQTQSRRPADEDVVSVNSLCHPVLKERTLLRLSESGDLQALIDQWGQSNLEELEAFIDSYFEKVWEQTMGSFQSPETDPSTAEQNTVHSGAGDEEVLLSIDRKLSKLELLEEIRGDLTELRQNLESSWKAIQELRDKPKNNSDVYSGSQK